MAVSAIPPSILNLTVDCLNLAHFHRIVVQSRGNEMGVSGVALHPTSVGKCQGQMCELLFQMAPLFSETGTRVLQ